MAPSRTQISSPNGRWRAEIDAEAAALKWLWLDHEPIVCVPQPESNFAFAGTTLAPWANRLRGGTWQLAGREFQADVNDRPTGTALHGLIVRTELGVLESSDNSVRFEHLFGSDAAYPFRLRLEVEYRLSDAGLAVQLRAENLDEVRLPMSLGSHPYFNLDPDSTLTLPARTIMVNDAQQTPVGIEPMAARGLSPGAPMAVDRLVLDDCLTDLEVEADGWVRTRLTRPSVGLTVELRQHPELSHLMVFTRRYREAGVDYPLTVALEPQSGPANALQSGSGLIWLEPTETVSLDWGVSVS